MIPNYLKTTWRNWKKNRGFFTLNFVGLYVSVVASILIALLIFHETSFDRSSDKGTAVYRIVEQATTSGGKSYNAVTPYPLATAMRMAMPDQSLISQIHFEKNGVFAVDNKNFKETNVVFADSVFPRLFPLTVKEGSIQRAFTEPGFAVLTKSTATRYFGKESAIGKKSATQDLSTYRSQPSCKTLHSIPIYFIMC